MSLLYIFMAFFGLEISAAAIETDFLYTDEGWSRWSDWSECSESCGGGLQARVRYCEGRRGLCEYGTLETEEIQCNEWQCYAGVWGEWSPCEQGFHYREKCEDDKDCQFEEEECGMMETLQPWSIWGECDFSTGRRSRERCGGEYGCEMEEEECDAFTGGDRDDGVWGEWGPCVQGLNTRHKCNGLKCSQEEMKACQVVVNWGDWGECVAGRQEREKCAGGGLWCEVESRKCGKKPMMAGHWSMWSLCEEDFQAREKCNGDECEYEERECDGGSTDEDSNEGWSDWDYCLAGFQEREMCSEYGCKMEVRSCGDETSSPEYGAWSDWSDCDSSGEKIREKCFPSHCEEEVKHCLGFWEDEPVFEPMDENYHMEYDQGGDGWSSNYL